MTTDLRDWADDHGYVRYEYRCNECGFHESGWSDSPMNRDDKCPACGYEPKDDPCKANPTARSQDLSPQSACS